MTAKVLEVERKRQLNTDVESMIIILKRHGFVLQSENTEVDTYYSRPDVDYMQTVECLRVRSRDDFAEITYKPASNASSSSSDGVIAKPETNLQIRQSDKIIAQQLLMCVGMIRLVEVNKQRKTFASPKQANLIIAIDSIKGAGTYIEIEVSSSNKDAAIEKITEVENLLEIGQCPIVNQPYRDICMEKGL